MAYFKWYENNEDNIRLINKKPFNFIENQKIKSKDLWLKLIKNFLI